MKKALYTVYVAFDVHWMREPFPETYTNKRVAKKRAYELYKLYKRFCEKGSLCEGFTVWVSSSDSVDYCIYERRG